MMEPAASSEEEQKGKQVGVASAALNITPAASDGAADKFNEALKSLEQCRVRISQRFARVGWRRVMGYTERRCLELMEMELSAIVAALKSYPPILHFYDDYYDSMLYWPTNLVREANKVLESTDRSRRHTVLPSALVYCCRRNSYRYMGFPVNDWVVMMYHFLGEAELAESWYKHLLPVSTTDNIDELLRQASNAKNAKAGGVPLFGIDRPMKKLLRWLAPCWEDTAERNHLSVMCVVGPVGIGKTTLAMALHNRLKCQTAGEGPYCFHYNIMVQMSRRKVRNKLLLQEILSKISDPATSAPSSYMADLVRHVSEQLQDKSYFICIDDMREESDWNEIKGAFPNNTLGSRVLITTSVGSTAGACCSHSDGLVHEMKPLNQVDSESLLLTRAFGSLDSGLPDNMKRFVDKILMRCDGIPLFINGMADWLKEQFQLQQHQQHEEEAKEKFETHDEELNPLLPKQLEQALSSAYDSLSSHLKILSLCMSMFPYGCKFDKDRLQARWMPEIFGLFRRSSMQRERYDVEKYFSELVDRNIITRVAAPYKSDLDEDEASQWHINHFMHQFLSSKSAEIGFTFTSDTLQCIATGRGSKTRLPRRLALHHPDPTIPSLLEELNLLQTRSLAVSGAVSGIPLDKFINLLVLHLEDWENLTDEKLLQVCSSKMMFLQYLSVRNTRVSKLPQEIKYLSSLKVLDVSYTQISKLPQEIKYLCSLIVLDVSYTQISELPLEVFELTLLVTMDLRGTRIGQLPEQIVELSWLRRLLLGAKEGMINNSVETATRVPHDIRRHLSLLETLATIDLSKQPASFMTALRGLRLLAIAWSFDQCIDQDYREALVALVSPTPYERCLESLTIHCGVGCSMEFLGSLVYPPVNLRVFKVTEGKFASVPKWISKLNYLSFLQITIRKQGREGLQILGGLPELQCLILGLDFIPSEAVVIESEVFPKLQSFSVDCPTPWLTFRNGAIRKLKYLQLKFCAPPVSETCVPSGIGSLQSLVDVALHYNERYAHSPSVKNTVKAVREQVASHINQIDLFINGVQDYDVQAVDKNWTGAQSGMSAEIKDDAQAVAEKLVNATIKTESTSEIKEVAIDA